MYNFRYIEKKSLNIDKSHENLAENLSNRESETENDANLLPDQSKEALLKKGRRF